MSKAPICIVGAGPAGITASLVLSKFCIEHILIERNAKSVDKVCGECYDNRLIKVFNNIDPNLTKELFNHNVFQILTGYYYTNSYNKQIYVDTTTNINAVRVVTHRPSFDAFLLKKALESSYVKYYSNTKLQQLKVNNSGIILETNNQSIYSNLAIIGTGYQALLPLVAKPSSFLVVSRRYYSNASMTKDQVVIMKIINKPYPCFFYSATLPNGWVTTELMVTKKTIDRYAILPDTVFDEVIKSDEFVHAILGKAKLEGKPKGAVLPKSSLPNIKLSAERILYAGSCVSHINPLTGWGVGHAVFEGYHAALKAVEAVENNNYSPNFLKSYDSVINKSLKNDFKMGRYADMVMQNFHKTGNLFLYFLASNKRLQKWAANAIVKY